MLSVVWSAILLIFLNSPTEIFTQNSYVAQAPFNNWEGYNAQHDGLSFTPFGNGLAQPRFYPGQWGPCSVTCGPGISTRAVECVAVQGLTSKVIKLPEYECEGSQKPSLFQPCQIRQCPLSESVDEPPTRETQLISSRGFKWDYGEWTQCSASCLGGKQKSTLKCIDETRKTAVAWSFCDAKQRPIDISRSCNNNPCPPEWSIGKMSECSHTCGGGLRSRKVRCIRRISRAGNPESTLILPDSQCPYPKPQDTEACGFVDCPIAWKVSQWSQCSASCDAGEQRRDVVCEQRTADGQIHKYSPPTPCKNLEKPPTIQICNLGSCDRETPLSLLSKDVEQQHKHHRKLTFNIGGHANLYQGTSIKVKCPVRNFTKSNIQWMKDGRIISNNAHTKVSTNGALRIFHARMEDAGVYTCLAGDVQGNVTLAFKPRDSTKEKSNEFQPPISSTLQDSTDILMDKTILERIRESLKNNGDSRMLGKLADIYDPVKIKIDYASGEWSICSQNHCGKSNGAQVRQLKCRVNYEGSVAYVDNEICDSLGVMRPPSSRSCTLALCPHWEASKWSECTLSRCIRYAISLQKRDVKCLYENGSIANYSQCDRSNRPKVKKECVNLNCTAEWRPSTWGSCSRTCGDGGVQMRLLRCVWRGTRKAAGKNCETSTRPAAIRSCIYGKELPPCIDKTDISSTSVADSQCMDKSRYCEILKLFHSCDNPEILQKCCHTCSYYRYRVYENNQFQ